MEGQKIFQVIECVICMDSTTTHVFIPCGHQCACKSCSNEIQEANMNCPMCRQEISKMVVSAKINNPQHNEVKTSEYSKFMERRNEYIEKLRRKCTHNAGFVGGGKLAKSVARGMADALEDLELQTAGSQRMMVGKKVDFEIQDSCFSVSYKPKGKRKKIVENYKDYLSKEELIDSIQEAGDWDVLDLASYEPRFYWLIHHHFEGKVENELNNKKKKKKINIFFFIQLFQL